MPDEITSHTEIWFHLSKFDEECREDKTEIANIFLVQFSMCFLFYILAESKGSLADGLTDGHIRPHRGRDASATK